MEILGGKLMDTFMDRLAHKLTAQEMIKANSAADAEEMNKLKSQIEGYQMILDRMQQLMDDSAEKLESGAEKFESGAAKIENAKVDDAQIGRLVDESIAKIEQMQQNEDSLEELRAVNEALKEELKAEIEKLALSIEDTKVDIEVAKAGIKEMRGSVEATKTCVEAAQVNLEESKNVIEESKVLTAESREAGSELREHVEDLKTLVEELKVSEDENKTAVFDRVKGVDDNVHRECVKVYRNVQAVVVDENGKQSDSFSYSFKEIKRKLGLVLNISIAALVAALGGLIFQVLVYLHII